MPRSRNTLLLKAKMFRGFADSSRLSVLEALRDGPRCVSDIVKATGLSQPNVSSHLACLEECGLVNRERRGRYIYYEMAHKQVALILEQAETILGEVGRQIYACTRYGERRR
jgi:DNA-binding transcriptional ArsR family regulator